jgi:hypothetical protein
MPPAPSDPVRYVVPLRPNVQLRINIEREEGKSIRFAVQLEYDLPGAGWRRVVCIDNWHSELHRDRYSLKGARLEHRRTFFRSEDIDRAIAWAVEHFESHVERYLSEFLRTGGVDT